MTDLPILAATLLANFLSIRFPTPVDRSAHSTLASTDVVEIRRGTECVGAV